MLVAILAYVSGVDGSNRAEVFSLLTVAFATGLFVRWFPWYRYHPNWFLTIGLAASALIALLIYWTGGATSVFFPLYFFVVVASGAYYTARPLILVTVVASVAAASYILYSGPPTLSLLLPALVLVPILVVVAIICNVLFRGLQRNVESAEFRARFIAALHDVDLAILAQGSLTESLNVATERLKGLLGCERAMTALWPVDGSSERSEFLNSQGERGDPPVGKGYTLTIPLEAKDAVLGELRLHWKRARDVTPELEQFARNFAAQLAIIVQNAQLSRQAEEARRLRELKQVQDEFISMVSHDLRTPLTSIVGFSELLIRRRISPGDQASAFEQIHRSAIHLARMVDDLLDITRLSTGRLELDLARQDLAALVRQVVETMRVVSNRHQLVVEGIDEPAWATMDGRRITEVLTNLIGNAIRYSPEGEEIKICLKGDDQEVTVSVEDHGIGIPSEDQSRIFEKFYRGANAVDVSSGTGLGLAICRGLIEAHGGKIWVESEGQGRGSRFSFNIPRSGPRT